MSPNRLDIDMFCQKPHMPTTPSFKPGGMGGRMKATGEHGMEHIATFKVQTSHAGNCHSF